MDNPDKTHENAGRLDRIVSWWKTPPAEDDLFFINIRKLYQSLFCPEIMAKRMVKEFVEIFPGKCMICSYHRFGKENGLTTKKNPPEHNCIDT